MLMILNRFILFISLIFLFVFFLLTPVSAALPAFEPQEGIYIYEATTGDVIAAQNENNSYIPASTTKMMTAHLLMKHVKDLNQQVTVGAEISVYGWADSRAKLWQGQVLSYRDLLYALLLPSGNDAAGTISVNVGRILLNDPNADWQTAKARFVEEMNREAKRLGATQTHFENPQGTYDETHHTTPKDFAKIVEVAAADPTIQEVCQTQSYRLKNEDGSDNVIENTDMLIYDTVPGALSSEQQAALIQAQNAARAANQPVPETPQVANPLKSNLVTAAKTGSTDEGGRTFVFYSEQNGAKIVGIIFRTGDQTIFTQSKAVLDEVNANYGFTTFSDENNKVDELTIENKNTLDNKTISLLANSPVQTYSNDLNKANYSTKIRLDDDIVEKSDTGNRLLTSIKEGEKLGGLNIYRSGQLIKTVPVYASDSINIITIPSLLRDYSDEVGIVMLATIFVLSIVLFRNRIKMRSEVKFS